MDQKSQPSDAAAASEAVQDADDATRRKAAERLAAMLALAPVAALLFDPHRAEADGDDAGWGDSP